jgi:nucleoside-diphosphate-sugar epimerase
LGLAGLIGNPDALGQAFHITSDEVLTWNQIVAEIAAALGTASPVIEKVPTDFICQVAPQMTSTLKGDKAHPGVFDNSKIKRAVPGFVCRKPFRAGIRESVEYLRAHPEEQNRKAELDNVCDQVIAAWRATAQRKTPLR